MYCFNILDASLRWQQNLAATAAVLDYRLPLLQAMISDPKAAADPGNWLELNLMVSEKFIAFYQAGTLFALGLARLPLDRPATPRQLARLQREALRPLEDKVRANARRLRGRRRS